MENMAWHVKMIVSVPMEVFVVQLMEVAHAKMAGKVSFVKKGYVKIQHFLVQYVPFPVHVTKITLTCKKKFLLGELIQF